ncbi:MAG: complex I subunit 5 family protein, partial [Thermoanaerobaculia bacterium]
AALLAALGLLAAHVVAGGAVETVTGGWPAGLGIRLRADALGVVFAFASAGLAVVTLAYELRPGRETPVFPALVLLQATGLTGLFLTGDAFNFYVFFEISMISGFALAGYGPGRATARAAVVFVLVNLLGSVFFLVGVAALYRLGGTLDMAALAEALAQAPAASRRLVGALLLSAFGLKLGLFPFHFWLPQVYRGVQPAVAALLAGALANLASYGLLRFGSSVLARASLEGRGLLLVLGCASILYGGVLAVSRADVREVLAYSAIGQVGYTFVAFALATPAAFTAAVLYSLVNSLNKTALFLAAGVRGLWVGPAFALGALSAAGLPPSAGFVAKVSVFRAALGADAPWVLAVLLTGSALSLVYMVRIHQRRHWHAARAGAGADGPAGSPAVARAAVAVLALVILGLGAWPEPLVRWSVRAAQAAGGGLP